MWPLLLLIPLIISSAHNSFLYESPESYVQMEKPHARCNIRNAEELLQGKETKSNQEDIMMKMTMMKQIEANSKNVTWTERIPVRRLVNNRLDRRQRFHFGAEAPVMKIIIGTVVVFFIMLVFVEIWTRMVDYEIIHLMEENPLNA